MTTMQPIEIWLNHLSPELFFESEEWVCQQKIDGKRCVVTCTAGELRAVTRNGNALKLSARSIALLPLGDYILDGENVRGDFTAFDVLSIGADDLRASPYSERLKQLERITALAIHTAYGESEKRALHQRVKSNGDEGVVFKKLSAKWRAGRTEFAQKLKNWKSDTFRVVSFDGKGIELEFDGKSAGRCAGAANPGDLVEVRFQDWTKAGKLMHPVMTEIRDDLR